MGIRDEVEQFLRLHRGKLKHARRLILFAVVVGVLIWLSTLDFGDDPQSNSFEGDFFLGFVTIAVVVLVGYYAVRWMKGGGRR